MRTSQRNLHHQLLRSGILITHSSRAGMPLRDQLGHFASDWLRNPITGIARCCARAASGVFYRVLRGVRGLSTTFLESLAASGAQLALVRLEAVRYRVIVPILHIATVS